MSERATIKVDWSKPFLGEADERVGELTLRDIVRPALLVERPDELSTADDKSARYDLWTKLRDSGELTLEEVQIIKRRVGVVCSPLALGRIFDVLPK